MWIKDYNKFKLILEHAGNAEIINALKDKVAETLGSMKNPVAATNELKDWIHQSDNISKIKEVITDGDSIKAIVEALEPWYDECVETLERQESGQEYAEELDSEERQKLGIEDDGGEIEDDILFGDDDDWGVDDD